MVLIALLFTILGSSIGATLALGTLWSEIKRVLQRHLARKLADIIPNQPSSLVIIAQNHSGKEKAIWLAEVLSQLVLSDSKPTVLDLAGGTHLEIVEEILPKVQHVEIFDGKLGLEFFYESRPKLLEAGGKVSLIEGNSVINISDYFPTVRLYDVLLSIEIIQIIPPKDRFQVVSEWVKFIKPKTGSIILVFESEPLSATAEAGILQGIFFRTYLSEIRLLLESCGISQLQTYRYENKIAISGRKVQTLEAGW